MTDDTAPWHAHIYYAPSERGAAQRLRARLAAMADDVRFVGALADGPVGPHPVPQFEVHFCAASRPAVVAAVEDAGLRALVHPLTDNDLADHTTLAQWLGEPLDLDLTVLDPPGANKGMARFGVSDF